MRSSFSLALLCSLPCSLPCLGCVGELGPTPECFSNGSQQQLEGSLLSLNLCCEPGPAGDRSCQEAMEAQRSPVAPLSYCAPSGRCEVCELGVSCACLEHLDCEDSSTRCLVTDDRALCAASLNAPPQLSRCALCSRPEP